MLDLDPIKARLARATPGQWIYRNTCEIWDPERPICEIEGTSVVPLDNDVKVLPYGQDLDLIVNAPRDLAALVEEVERLRQDLEFEKAKVLPILEEVARLRRQNEVSQAQIRAYEKALTWYALPENWKEQVDDRGRDTLRFRWAEDGGEMARHALSVWRQSDGAKKVENNLSQGIYIL